MHASNKVLCILQGRNCIGRLFSVQKSKLYSEPRNKKVFEYCTLENARIWLSSHSVRTTNTLERNSTEVEL